MDSDGSGGTRVRHSGRKRWRSWQKMLAVAVVCLAFSVTAVVLAVYMTASSSSSSSAGTQPTTTTAIPSTTMPVATTTSLATTTMSVTTAPPASSTVMPSTTVAASSTVMPSTTVAATTTSAVAQPAGTGTESVFSSTGFIAGIVATIALVTVGAAYLVNRRARERKAMERASMASTRLRKPHHIPYRLDTTEGDTDINAVVPAPIEPLTEAELRHLARKLPRRWWLIPARDARALSSRQITFAELLIEIIKKYAPQRRRRHEQRHKCATSTQPRPPRRPRRVRGRNRDDNDNDDTRSHVSMSVTAAQRIGGFAAGPTDVTASADDYDSAADDDDDGDTGANAAASDPLLEAIR